MSFGASPFASGSFGASAGEVSAPPPDLEPVATGTPSFPIAISVFETGTLSFPIAISVVSPLVFSAGQYAIRWSPVVVIGGVNVSARLSGQIDISAGEDSARLATLQVIPASSADLASYEGQPVTIDVVLFRTGQTATYRLFTGVVESREFLVSDRVVTLSCRDGYQERPKACQSAAEVEALFGGLAYPSAALLPWSDATPDPAAYFNGLLDSLLGTVFIDSSGIWRARPWSIGSPAETFSAGQIFDGSLTVIDPARADLPVEITATMTHRFPRLHAVDIPVMWEAVERVRFVVDGLPTASKSMIQSALDGLSEWHIKGTPTLVSPLPGSWPVIVGGATVYYLVDAADAPLMCESMEATLYRRWYQEVEATYTVTLPVGGSSDRTESVATSIASEFDTGRWESSPSSDSGVSLYQANAPASPSTPTGYEALLPPWPPGNGALDHYADITLPALQDAAEHTVARALRQAAAGKRQRRVRFERQLDPRWEIGDVLGVSAYGVSAVGQLAEIEHVLDMDTGDIATTMTLAVPDGTGTTTAFTATVTPPAAGMTHAYGSLVLGNPVGAAFETPAVPDESTLLGYLSNVVSTSDNYDASKPVYQPQFRIVMPPIAAAVRDPAKLTGGLSVSYSIAAGSLSITF